MHAPNMFLFRYAYLFSFLVLLLAGKGWEKIEQDDRGLLLGIILVVAALLRWHGASNLKEATPM